MGDTRNKKTEVTKTGCKGLMPRMLFPLLGEWIHTIDLDDGRTLCQVRSDNDLWKSSQRMICE